MIQKGDKRLINAWVFYDWANSAYPLIITAAIFPIFYENITSSTSASGEVNDMVQLFGMNFKNTALYSYVISLSFLIVTFSSPILSGIADYSGNKKRFMQLFCYLGSFSCASLYFFNSAHLGFGMLSILFASIGYWGSSVFYNGFLPEIAEPEQHDKVSAKGYSLGYLGSAILLIINLIMIMNYEALGFETKGAATRVSFLTVGLWWAGFSQITFMRLPNNVYGRKPEGKILLNGFLELKKVWKELKKTRRLRKYLSSFFVFSMGVQTVMLMAVLFAKKEIEGLADTDLIVSVLLIQFVGILGAYLFSWLSKKLGNIKAIGVAIFIWIGICVGTYLFVYTPNQFYVVAAFVGLVMAGIQTLARSTYSKFLPDTVDHASYFSFYEVCEKIGIVIGTFSFGYIEELTGSMRSSILALIIFFVLAFFLLMRVPKEESYYVSRTTY